MKNDLIREKIENLRLLIEEYNYHYYTLSNPIISDSDFDLLLHQLEELEKAYPEYYSPLSPTQRVGSDKSDAFRQANHKEPMLSLSNTYNYQEIALFYSKIQQALGSDKDFYITAELKFDGTSISIIYKNGELHQAITRGDGTMGDDVTNNIKTIKSLPLRLRGKFKKEDIDVRGEVLLPYSSFEEINKEREREGEPPFANPRNAAAGTLKSLDAQVVSKRKLDVILYALLGDSPELSDSHYDRLEQACQAGLKTSPYSKKCSSLQEIYDFVSYWDTHRHDLPVATDGIVLKLDSIDQQKLLGTTSKYPKWAIAYKYQAENVRTQLQDVIFQVGRTGVVTPVAVLTPVLISGSVVQRATLHNEDFIRSLDLRKDDYVFIEKGGEIIPKITSVDISLRVQEAPQINYPLYCPDCGTPLQRIEGDTAIVCPNTEGCPTQAIERIEHYCGKKAANIHIGPETITLLFKNSIIAKIDDLYQLQAENFKDLRGFQEKSISRLLASIEESKKRPFYAILFGLGIRFVGETTAKQLAKIYKNIEALRNATHEELLAVPEVGEKIAEQIILYFQSPKTIALIDNLLNKGVLHIDQDESSTENSEESLGDQPLKGKAIVVSGVFSKMSREEYKSKIEAWGGKCTSSISAKTDFILAGENMGPSKKEKAEALGIPILSEEAFWESVNLNK